MKRLAKLADNDKTIREELRSADIAAVSIERKATDEIPAGVMGQLGRFAFRRMTAEWAVSGDMPLEFAAILHHHFNNSWTGIDRPVLKAVDGGQIIIPRGTALQRGSRPDQVFVYKDADGVLLEPMSKEIKSKRMIEEIYGKGIEGKPAVRFVYDPAQEGRPYIVGYSIVHIKGLRLFADFVREHKLV